MKYLSCHLTFLRFFWLLMAFHILFIEAEFPEALEERTISGFTLTSKNLPKSSYIKKFLSSTPADVPQKKLQEDVIDLPDYVPLGLKCRAEVITHAVLPIDAVFDFKEISRPQYNPDSIYQPPRLMFS